MHRRAFSTLFTTVLGCLLVLGCTGSEGLPTGGGGGFNPLVIETSTLPDAVVDEVYGHALSASGGSGGYAWSLAQGSLPEGIALSSSGILSGAPTAAGSFAFIAQVASTDGQSTTKQLTLDVTAPTPVGESSP